MPLSLIAFKHPANHRRNKILAVAALCGLEIESPDVDLGTECDSTAWHLNCHPLGKNPVLQTDEGYLFESNAIIRYLARNDKTNSHLYGRTHYESSQVDMWLDFAQTELVEFGNSFAAAFYFGVPMTPEQLKEVQTKVDTTLCAVDRWLETRTFFVGERLTIADVVVSFTLDWVYRLTPDFEGVKKHKNVLRLYNTVMNQPKIVEMLRREGAEIGLTNFHVKMKEAEAAAAKKEAEKKAKEAKEAKPAPAAAAAESGDADEEEEAPAKKKVNPLDLLPPSTFVLDAFKREYSNKDTRTVAVPYLFSNYDPKGFSAFFCKYKYNTDLTMQFMTANLIRGWFQRMDHTRKYAFGSVLIVGEERSHEIVGFWIFRGHGIPEIVMEVEDTELFDWTPVDMTADDKKVTDFLAHDGPTFGDKVLEGRVFK